MKKFFKYFFRFILIVLVIVLLPSLIFWIQAISLNGVNSKVISYNSQLKTQLKKDGYKANFVITSGKRWKFHNDFLVWSGSGAAKNSQHLRGNAIDIMVLDVNSDGSSNAKDVDIVYNILNKKIIGSKGGIGTYKNAGNFFDRQMVHFDCRGRRARWHR